MILILLLLHLCIYLSHLAVRYLWAIMITGDHIASVASFFAQLRCFIWNKKYSIYIRLSNTELCVFLSWKLFALKRLMSQNRKARNQIDLMMLGDGKTPWNRCRRDTVGVVLSWRQTLINAPWPPVEQYVWEPRPNSCNNGACCILDWASS